MDEDLEDWIEILLPYLPVFDEVAHKLHIHLHKYDHLHQEVKEDEAPEDSTPIKKNNYGYFTCK